MRLRHRTLFGSLIGSLAILLAMLPSRSPADNLDAHRIIQERINWWKTDPRGKPYFQEITPVPSVSPTGGKAHALCIGLNFVNPNAYEGWDGQLAGCIKDADAMVKIANDLKFDSVTRMIDGQATRREVFSYLERKKKELQSGDLLMISYSGHGSQAPDTNGDEGDDLDETWCLHDGQVLDDELGALWPEFATGVRILIISDSCHSGTVAKVLASVKKRQEFGENFLKKGKLSDSDELIRRAEKRKLDPFGNKEAKNVPHAFRMMPEEVMKKINTSEKHIAAFKEINDKYKRDRDASQQINATVLLISGCQDDQTSMDGSENGLFTGTLLAVWKDGSFSGNYRQFHEAIFARMPGGQKPNLFMFGKDTEGFSGGRPFQK
jgi:hypothetical protein